MIAFYVSGHGFGHASRDIEVLNELGRRRPEIGVVLRTSAPRWIFDLTLKRPVDWRPRESDTGVVQIDSLSLDAAETIRRAEKFHRDLDQDAAEEAEWLRREGITLVVGDIPPLAFAAAAQARIPSVAVGNFTWDWIYSGYEAFSGGVGGVLASLRAAYSTATRALRLPLHGGFDSMAAVTTDIPFIARRSRLDPAQTRARLGIAGDRPFVLASFSAADLDLPYSAIAEAEDLTVLAPEREPPASLTYPDLVAAADVVVSKPGYGIVSECVANGTALLYTSRGHFIEYDVFVAEMPGVLRCRYLAREDFLSGRWGAAVRALLAQAPPPERARVDGARIAAEAILDVAIG